MNMKYALGAAACLAALSVTPASAAVFQGTTAGCFGLSCSFGSPVSDGTLVFTGGNFGPTNISSTGNVTLGSFSVTNSFFNDLDNDTFRLRIDFSQPSGASPDPQIFSATLDGNIGLFGGNLVIDFANTPTVFTFNGGTFSLLVQDVQLDTNIFRSGDTANLLGSVSVTAAVPEPSTWAMLLIGFAGVGFTAYRRRFKTTAPESI